MLEVPLLNVELFKINSVDLNEACRTTKITLCTLDFVGKKSHYFFQSNLERLYHIANLMEIQGIPATVCVINNEPRLVVIGDFEEQSYFPFWLEEMDYEIVVKPENALSISHDSSDLYPAIRLLINNAIRNGVKLPLMAEDYSIFDTGIDLTIKINTTLRNSPLTSPIKAYFGFSHRIRKFNNVLFLQLSPSSHLRYDKNFHLIMKELVNKDKVLEHFPYGSVPGTPITRGRKIMESTTLSIDDPIEEFPYYGRSFREYAKAMFPNLKFTGVSRLMKLGSIVPQYFPAELVHPSLTFRAISLLNNRYYSSLLGIIKAKSAERPNHAKEAARTINSLIINGRKVELSHEPLAISYDSKELEPKDLGSISTMNTGRVFAPPSVNFLRFGEEVEISKGQFNLSATVNDLMKDRDLRPLNVPKEISIIVFLTPDLKDGWSYLKTSLLSGKGSYRGLKDTFDVEATFHEVVVDNLLSKEFESEVEHIENSRYHSAIVIVNRETIVEESQNRMAYIEPKKAIMKKGIPVQIVNNYAKETLNRDYSLKGQSTNANYLFG